MTIPALSAISSVLPVQPSAPTTSASPTSGSDFASVLGKGLDAVSQAQSKADNLAVQAATGDLTNIHDYTIAATQASLMTELATTIRTKGVDAFNQIMGMQA
jgi:flagellar hook-basal body complex protein FliE